MPLLFSVSLEQAPLAAMAKRKNKVKRNPKGSSASLWFVKFHWLHQVKNLRGVYIIYIKCSQSFLYRGHGLHLRWHQEG